MLTRDLREVRALYDTTLEAIKGENQQTLNEIWTLHHEAMTAVLALGDAIPVALQTAQWRGVASGLRETLESRPAAGGEVLSMIGRPRRGDVRVAAASEQGDAVN